MDEKIVATYMGRNWLWTLGLEDEDELYNIMYGPFVCD